MKPLKKVPRPIPKIIRLPLHKSLLVLLLLFPTFLPQQLLAYDFSVTVPSGQRLYFDYVTDWSGDAVTVVSNGYNYCSGDLVIPSTVTSSGRTYTVIGIEQEAFVFCFRLTSITIPNSVTSIGSKAFKECTRLYKVNIPNSVTSIDYQAFSGTRIDSIIIPEHVLVHQSAFSDCSQATYLSFGYGSTAYSHSFSGCTGLRRLVFNAEVFPKNLT